MSIKSYSMPEQIKIGEEGEIVLDKYYRKQYIVEPVCREMQRIGIDRIWINKMTGFSYSVEYKSDSKADKTDNIFVETVSVSRPYKIGWAYSCCAQIIVYYIPPLDIAYRIKTLSLKSQVPEWVKIYKKVPAFNKRYTTYGIAVPITEFTKYCWKIDNMTA